MGHVRFAPVKMKKADTNVSWEAVAVGAVVVEVFVNLNFDKEADGDEEMLVVEDGDDSVVMILDFLLVLLLCPLLLHVSKLNLDFGFGFDNGAVADSSEDPDSDPCCCAFLFPVFD